VTIKATDRLDLQASQRYSPAVTLAQGRTLATWWTSAGASFKVDEHTSVSLWVSDPFAAYRYGSDSHDATFVQSTRSSSSIRGVSLGFSHSWGKPPEQKQRKQKGDAPSTDAPATTP
jgi:hypothetical protein